MRKLKYVVEVHSAATNRHSECLPPSGFSRAQFRVEASLRRLEAPTQNSDPGLPPTSDLLKINPVGGVLIARSSNLKRDVDSLVRVSHLS